MKLIIITVLFAGSALAQRPTTLAAYSANSASSSPVSSLADLSGNGFALTGQNAVGWSAGQTPNGSPAISLNGTNQAFYTTAFPATITNPSSQCVYAVINPAALGSSMGLTSNQYGGTAFEVGVDATGHVYADDQNTLALGTSTGTVAAGTWSRIAACYDGTTTSFYINGVASGTASVSGSVGSPGINYIGVGNLSGTRWFHGQIAEVDIAAGPYNAAFDTFFLSTYINTTIPTPTISPASGRYSSAQTVTMACSVSGSTMFYTTDGTTPTSDSTTYTGGFSTVSSGTETVNSICSKSGSVSAVASATYLIGSLSWYVRADGGTRYSVNHLTGQCDGLANAAYPGTGANQHCAFNDIRYLWTDNSYTTDPNVGAPLWGWIGSGGDKYIIDCAGMAGGSCRIGQSGPNSGDGFGLYGFPAASGAPAPPSGTPDAHTQLLGVNHGSCTSQSARTKINGGYGTSGTLSMGGAAYVDVECFDITDHSSCGKAGQTSACHTDYPFTDFANYGIVWTNTSNHDTLRDIRIHGLASDGMIGPTGDSVVMTDIQIVGNAHGGWNADLGNSTTGVGSLLVQNYEISWNGCAEEYPIVDALPYSDCTDDGSSGYGDGFGTATVASAAPGWQAHFDQGKVYNNTQDGLDALHLIGTGSSMTITRTLAYGNMGQQIKVGGASGTAQNNVIVTNCNALRQAIPGTPVGYNSKLGNFCRAADTGIELTVGKGSTLKFQGNTIYSASSTGIELDCDGYAGECDSTSLIDFRDNIFVGFLNSTGNGYVGSPTNDYSNVIYTSTVNPFPNPGSVFSDNVTFHPKSSWSCPSTGLSETSATCGDPHLTDESWHLYGFGDMTSTSATPKGVALAGVATDYLGVTRSSTPTIGGFEYVSSTPTASSPSFSPGAGTYTGTQTVTLSTTSAGAVICYNTTGSPATNGSTGCAGGSTLYTGPLAIAATATIRAVAGGTGWLDSAVASAGYVISSPASGVVIQQGTQIWTGSVVVQ